MIPQRVLKNRSPDEVLSILIQGIKGGTGKSTTAVEIARRLAAKGYKTGLIDMDVESANVPHMLGLDGQTMGLTRIRRFIPVEKNGLKIWSPGLMFNKQGLAFTFGSSGSTWVVKSPFKNTQWENVDIFVIDLPAGSGDIFKEVVHNCKNVIGNVIVTLPDMKSDLIAAIDLSVHYRLKITGVIENMGYIKCKCGHVVTCKHCDTVIHTHNEEGIEEACKVIGVPWLGKCPISLSYMQSMKDGNAHVPDSDAKPIMKAVEIISKAIDTVGGE